MKPGGAAIALATLIRASTAAAAADEEPICGDRPGLGTPTCTVPAGTVQVETGFVDWIVDRSEGLRGEDLVIGETAVKFGIAARLHLETVLAPYVRSRAREEGSEKTLSGVGDFSLGAKYRLTDGDAPIQIAVRAFLKIPTAKRPLGNGKVEGGLVVPLEYRVASSQLSLALSPEVDLVADSDGSGRHVALMQVAGLAAQLSSRISASAELAGAWDLDPSGTVRQYALGASAAYLLSRDMQVDAGLNLGLNRSTPDREIYCGIALRF